MNRENIQKVRDHIAKLPAKRFQMSEWIARRGYAESPTLDEVRHDCGTCACIGGWTLALLSAKRADHFSEDRAADLLGLTEDEAAELFRPEGWSAPGLYTRPHAVRVLDHLLATGEVDWESTRRAKKTAGGSGSTSAPHGNSGRDQ